MGPTAQSSILLFNASYIGFPHFPVLLPLPNKPGAEITCHRLTSGGGGTKDTWKGNKFYFTSDSLISTQLLALIGWITLYPGLSCTHHPFPRLCYQVQGHGNMLQKEDYSQRTLVSEPDMSLKTRKCSFVMQAVRKGWLTRHAVLKIQSQQKHL